MHLSTSQEVDNELRDLAEELDSYWLIFLQDLNKHILRTAGKLDSKRFENNDKFFE